MTTIAEHGENIRRLSTKFELIQARIDKLDERWIIYTLEMAQGEIMVQLFDELYQVNQLLCARLDLGV
jgi:hypothetical protein